jgi:predicted small secreted protein
MKRGIIIMFLVIIMTVSGCVTSKVISGPSEDIVIGIMTPVGPMPVIIEKGWFDDEENYKLRKDVKIPKGQGK